jgi:hypothetical protein
VLPACRLTISVYFPEECFTHGVRRCFFLHLWKITVGAPPTWKRRRSNWGISCVVDNKRVAKSFITILWSTLVWALWGCLVAASRRAAVHSARHTAVPAVPPACSSSGRRRPTACPVVEPRSTTTVRCRLRATLSQVQQPSGYVSMLHAGSFLLYFIVPVSDFTFTLLILCFDSASFYSLPSLFSLSLFQSHSFFPLTFSFICLLSFLYFCFCSFFPLSHTFVVSISFPFHSSHLSFLLPPLLYLCISFLQLQSMVETSARSEWKFRNIRVQAFVTHLQGMSRNFTECNLAWLHRHNSVHVLTLQIRLVTICTTSFTINWLNFAHMVCFVWFSE